MPCLGVSLVDLKGRGLLVFHVSLAIVGVVLLEEMGEIMEFGFGDD